MASGGCWAAGSANVNDTSSGTSTKSAARTSGTTGTTGGPSTPSSAGPRSTGAGIGTGAVAPRVETLTHGLFADVQVVRPAGAVQRVVLSLSGTDGVTAADRARALTLADAGAMVATIDSARFLQRLQAEGGRCAFANGALENLGRHLQAFYRLAGYQPPMLVGRGAGGTLAYAMLAQAAPGTFASALSLGFCPRLPFQPPLCEANALRLAPAGGGAAGGGAAGGGAAGGGAAGGGAGRGTVSGGTANGGAAGGRAAANRAAAGGSAVGGNAAGGSAAGSNAAGGSAAGSSAAVRGATGDAAAGSAGSDLVPSQRFAAPWTVLADVADARDAGAAGGACPAARAFVDATPQAQWREPNGTSNGTSSSAPSGTPRSAPNGTPSSPPSGTSTDAAADAAFRSAYAELAARTVLAPPPPASLADLPLVEVPVTAAQRAAAGAGAAAQFAVLLSGDGGWAGIDKDIAAALAQRGVPVVGFDSLRYFWQARTPAGLAADLDRLILHYAARWGRAEVVLIGYSQGADVLPFALNRLPAATHARVALTALLGPGQNASFEFHVANWMGRSGDQPIAPEARRLSAAEVLCVRGSDERDSLCPALAPRHARELVLRGGHHFDGDHDKLARLLLEAVQRR